MDADNGLRYSAVLIAYNEEAHIMDAIQSLKAQSVPPYRIVVVDDGSTDGTRAYWRRARTAPAAEA